MKKYMKDVIFENRKKLNLTQEELAIQLSVSNKTVSKWERGLSYPDVLLIPKLANVLNISINELYDVVEVKEEKVQSSNEISFHQKYKKSIIISILLFVFSPAIYLLSFLFELSSEFITLSLFIGFIMLTFSIVFGIYKTIEMIMFVKSKRESKNILVNYSLVFSLIIYTILSCLTLFMSGTESFLLGSLLYIVFILIPIVFILVYKIRIISKVNIVLLISSTSFFLLSIVALLFNIITGNNNDISVMNSNISIFCYLISQILNYTILFNSLKSINYN